MCDSFVLCRGDAESQNARDALRKVTFDLPSESEGEDVEDILGGKSKNITKPERKSAFEKRQEKVCFRKLSRCLMGFVCLFLHWRYKKFYRNIFFCKYLHHKCSVLSTDL